MPCIRLSMRFLFVSSAALWLSACAPVDVKAWQKSALAKPSMALDGNVLEAKVADHTFQSKEGSRGTMSVGGGGCGCK